MVTKRSYRRIKVNQIDCETLRERAIERGGRGTCVGLDIAKSEIVAVIRWPDGTFDQPWKVQNPFEISSLIERLKILEEVCDSLVIGLESTGTYGDAVRLAMTAAKLEVHRVSGKAVSDYREIFDGVSSQHDGKDAAMIAELAHYGKGKPWPYTAPNEADEQMRHDVLRYCSYVSEKTRWLNRIEGMLARHWPELTKSLALTSGTLLEVCSHYGSPARLAADADAAKHLRQWSRGAVGNKVIRQIIESARGSAGLPMSESGLAWLGELACNAKECRKKLVQTRRSLGKQVESHPVMSGFSESAGAVSLCAIWVSVGDPAQYTSSGAFLKALGLNLKELSSGKRNGEMAISKRGSAHARKVLYYWAMRSIQRQELSGWYSRFIRVGRGASHRNSEYRKMKALVALMRGLSAGLWYARVHGEAFDYSKVFPGRPLTSGRGRGRRGRSASTR